MMAEAALTFPVVLLLTLALINFALVGFASVVASNAANYGARAGSVAQNGAAGAAATAANQALGDMMIGTYSVAASGGGAPGSQVVVQVSWTIPNWFGPILSFVGGGGMPSEFTGTARSTFRKEGW